MKFVFLVILLSLLLVGVARTQFPENDFHGSHLECAECHTMHYSQQHDYSGNVPSDYKTGDLRTDGLPANSDSGGPFEKLLIKGNVTDLCLVCHDGMVGIPDVYEADINELDERAAGFFTDLGDLSPNGHNLGHNGEISLGMYACIDCHTDWDFSGAGAMPTMKVGCINCHDPHGRDRNSSEYRYRNLQWATYPGYEPIITAYMNMAASGLKVYERANITYVAPTPTDPETPEWREVTNICIDCHHTLTGDGYTRDVVGSNDTCERHPVTESERGVWEPIDRDKVNHPADPDSWATDPTNWTSAGTGFDIPRLPFLVTGVTAYEPAGDIVAENNEVFCLSCHKAHGSANPFSLRWSATSNSGCQQCHNR